MPELLENSEMSQTFDPWLVGDTFRYVCNQQLVLIGDPENECMDINGEAVWSLSTTLNNFPVCGKVMYHLNFVQREVDRRVSHHSNKTNRKNLKPNGLFHQNQYID